MAGNVGQKVTNEIFWSMISPRKFRWFFWSPDLVRHHSVQTDHGCRVGLLSKNGECAWLAAMWALVQAFLAIGSRHSVFQQCLKIELLMMCISQYKFTFNSIDSFIINCSWEFNAIIELLSVFVLLFRKPLMVFADEWPCPDIQSKATISNTDEAKILVRSRCWLTLWAFVTNDKVHVLYLLKQIQNLLFHFLSFVVRY